MDYQKEKYCNAALIHIKWSPGNLINGYFLVPELRLILPYVDSFRLVRHDGDVFANRIYTRVHELRGERQYK